MVVGVDPEREDIGQPGHRVGRFEHLPGVKRVGIGVIVAHAFGDFQQYTAHGVHIRRTVQRRQVGKARVQMGHHFAQQIQTLHF